MKKYIALILSFLILLSSVPCVFASDNLTEKYVYRNDTYDFDIAYGDPMVITDEAFFGSWDAEELKWIDEPYFKYDEFPGLAEVEAAAKLGDYATAKEALYAYYIPEKYNKVKKIKKIESSALLDAEKLARNLYATDTTGVSIAITDFVGTDWQRVNCTEILSYIKSMVSLGNDYVTIMIASIDKSNTPAEIKSRDTDEPPTLNLVVNNVQMSFPAVADGYISPATNANTVYGDEEILYAQEYGYTSQWSDWTTSWGAESAATKRTMIKFDISGINSNANISSASLDFTARTAPGGDLEEKELFIYGWGDNTWKESNLRWNSYTDWLFISCNEQEAWSFITSHSASLKGKMCYFHRGTKFSAPYSLYDYTQDEKYAYTFIRQMMSQIYHVDPRIGRVYNELDAANNVNALSHGFIYCWGSEYMNGERFAAFMKHLYLTVELYITFMENEDNLSNTKLWNNWATNMTRGTYMMCQTYPEFKRADFWYDVTTRHNARLYGALAFEDGVSIEQGLGYIGTALATISGAMDVSAEIQKPYYGMFCTDEVAPIIAAVVKNYYYSTAPGYTGFSFGDSCDYGVSFEAKFAAWYRYLKTYFNIDEPDLEYIATKGKSGKLPDFTSISFPVGLRTYMRTDWSANAVALGFSAKMANESHAHNDALTISLMAYGQHLLIDPSYGSVLTGDSLAYMSHAAQHNTITVNGGNLSEKTSADDGELVEQEINEIYDMVTYRYVHGDYMSNYERTVFFPKNQKFFVVSDYVVPSDTTRVNTYTQFWHMQPMANISLTDDGKNEFRSNFENSANVIVSPVDSQSMSDIRFEDTKYAPKAGVFMANKKGVYERKSTGAVKYATIIYPMETGDDRSIVSEPVDVGVTDEGASAFRFMITNPKDNSVDVYYYYHLNDQSQRKDINIGSYKTDASTMFIQEDISGNVKSFFVFDGSYVESTNIKDKYLFKTANGEKVSISSNMNAGNFVEISAENVADDNVKTFLENVTLYTGFNSTTSTFDGERITYSSKDGAYMYFGDTPIVNCTETAPENSGNGNSFGSFTGGGGGGGGAAMPPKEDVTEESDKDDVVEDENSSKPVVTLPTYTDVDLKAWYYDDVSFLTNMGILSGDGTGKFGPNDNVTREQFLKMIMMATDVDVNSAENTFADVDDNAWYKDFVLTAKNLGIVNGVSDTDFGIGSNITRQDMAVMITRTLQIMNIKTTSVNSGNFVDGNIVSGYAMDSVRFMKSIGLIQGYNNEFRPLDTLTRAEASKVVAELIKIVNAQN